MNATDRLPLSTRRRRVRAVALLVAAGLGLSATTACSSGSGDAEAPGTTASAAPDRSGAVSALVAQVFVPSYDRLASTTDGLAKAVGTLCADAASMTDAAKTQSAQASYRQAREAWLTTTSFRFGPVMDLAAESAIGWPVDADKVDALLTADPTAALTPDAVQRRGADQRGLGGIEHVLFGVGPLNARPCSYLVSASSLVHTKGADVARAWREPTAGKPSGADQMTKPGADGMWATEHEVLTDVVNGTVAALSAAGDRSLGKAAGVTAPTPEATEVDAGRARTALADSRAMVEGVRRIHEAGVAPILAGPAAATATRLEDQLIAALAAIDAVPAPLHDLGGGTEPVKQAYERVRDARVTLRTEVASQLGVTLTFSDSDGDG